MHDRRQGCGMKKKIMLFVIAVFALAALTACASAGREFDRTHVNDIKIGVQDKSRIRAWFGEPYQRETISATSAGCVERWMYVYAFSTYAGAKTKSSSLVVDFDRNGKVCDHAYVGQ